MPARPRSADDPPKRTPTFGCEVHTWCSNSDDPKADDGEMYARVGVDVAGGVEPGATGVVWTSWKRMTKDWLGLSIAFEVVGPEATVFVEGWNKYRLAHNDLYVDAASLTVPMDPDPEPGPDPEPVPETEQVLMVVHPEEGVKEIPLYGQVRVAQAAENGMVMVTDERRGYLVAPERVYLAVFDPEVAEGMLEGDG